LRDIIENQVFKMDKKNGDEKQNTNSITKHGRGYTRRQSTPSISSVEKFNLPQLKRGRTLEGDKNEGNVSKLALRNFSSSLNKVKSFGRGVGDIRGVGINNNKHHHQYHQQKRRLSLSLGGVSSGEKKVDEGDGMLLESLKKELPPSRLKQKENEEEEEEEEEGPPTLMISPRSSTPSHMVDQEENEDNLDGVGLDSPLMIMLSLERDDSFVGQSSCHDDEERRGKNQQRLSQSGSIFHFLLIKSLVCIYFKLLFLMLLRVGSIHFSDFKISKRGVEELKRTNGKKKKTKKGNNKNESDSNNDSNNSSHYLIQTRVFSTFFTVFDCVCCL